MKCLVFSDSHGNSSYISKALQKHPDAEVVFFIGDGISDAASIADYDASRMWLAVRGNCDFSHILRNAEVKKTEEITLLGKKIFLTHGDLYDVKYGLDRLKYASEAREADIVLFGHTHIPYEEYVSGEHPYYLFNPGSISSPSYSFGIITLDFGSVLFSHGKL